MDGCEEEGLAVGEEAGVDFASAADPNDWVGEGFDVGEGVEDGDVGDG